MEGEHRIEAPLCLLGEMGKEVADRGLQSRFGAEPNRLPAAVDAVRADALGSEDLESLPAPAAQVEDVLSALQQREIL